MRKKINVQINQRGKCVLSTNTARYTAYELITLGIAKTEKETTVRLRNRPSNKWGEVQGDCNAGSWRMRKARVNMKYEHCVIVL